MSTKASPITAEHERILSACKTGLLSTIRHKDGLISTNPVGYLWNGEEIEISTLKSRVKYRNLAANPMATLCVVSPEDSMVYVEVRGRARLEDDPERRKSAEIFKKGTGFDMPRDLDPPDAERVTIYLRPEQVSSPTLYGGRFHKR